MFQPEPFDDSILFQPDVARPDEKAEAPPFDFERLAEDAWRAVARAVRRGKVYEARGWMKLAAELRQEAARRAGEVRWAEMRAERGMDDVHLVHSDHADVHSVHWDREDVHCVHSEADDLYDDIVLTGEAVELLAEMGRETAAHPGAEPSPALYAAAERLRAMLETLQARDQAAQARAARRPVRPGA